jgi:glycogen debranching enzyme
MSKNWMHAVWSWDHCFNALGLAGSHPDLAWDQFMLPFDLQTGQGTLPDLFHDNGWLLGFVKPPIHGWALSKLIAAGLVTDTRLEEIYPKLESWTRWWLHYRDDDGDGLCEYFHGCDSGQDNATVFDSGFPAVGPDLAAYLIIQMDVLADIAGRLEMTDEATLWQGHAEKMLALLLGRLWDGQRFRVERTGDQAWNPESHSLVVFLPMILGDRLPADVRMKLVMDFRGSGLLTDYGPATESPDSRLFERDGYWRGPIWAPTTLLIVDGLNACGERELAEEVASRFIGICQVSGFAENFDAMTGQSLRDPAYSWTASTFLVLAAEYLQLGKIFNKS